MLVKSRQTPRNYNISVLERNALKELQPNPKIIIKPADKGGSIVILNATDYVREAIRQLSNTAFYRLLSGDPTERFTNERNCILDDALQRKWITQKQFDF